MLTRMRDDHPVLEFTVMEWVLLAVAALLVGFSKTAIGGGTAIAVAIFATVLPARESTGALLPLLLCADVLAVSFYRRHADWSVLWRLFPWVAIGTVIGAAFIARVDNTAMRQTIGVLLLFMIGVQIFGRGERLRQIIEEGQQGHRVIAAAVGIAAGFATMVANAASAVMTIYLLLSGLTMLQFLGTGAWFFFIVNAFKLPFSIALGLVTVESLTLNLVLVPAVIVGGIVGLYLIRRIKQEAFARAVLALAAVSAIPLIL
jgi:uncharacterized protein